MNTEHASSKRGIEPRWVLHDTAELDALLNEQAPDRLISERLRDAVAGMDLIAQPPGDRQTALAVWPDRHAVSAIAVRATLTTPRSEHEVVRPPELDRPAFVIPRIRTDNADARAITAIIARGFYSDEARGDPLGHVQTLSTHARTRYENEFAWAVRVALTQVHVAHWADVWAAEIVNGFRKLQHRYRTPPAEFV